MEEKNDDNNNKENPSSNNNKKRNKLNPIKGRMTKSLSQTNILKNKTNRVFSPNNLKKKSNPKDILDKKLFNNANDYQFLYKDISNTRFVVLWVKYLRNFPYSPGPVQHLGVDAPSFYEKDLESFLKKRKTKKRIDRNNNNKANLDLSPNKWNNLSMSNELRNKRYNEFLPHIVQRNDRYLHNGKEYNNENYYLKSRYLHPFQYNFRKVTMIDGNVIKQRYLKYDKDKTLKAPSLLFSSSKYTDKCNISNYNNVKQYLNMHNAFDLVKWQNKLRNYETKS